MRDIFYRVPATDELMHPRVKVTRAPNTLHAHDLVVVLVVSLAVGTDCPGAADRSGDHRTRGRATIAELVARRDRALDREIAAKLVKQRRAAIRTVRV